jgi:hypothetical protein
VIPCFDFVHNNDIHVVYALSLASIMNATWFDKRSTTENLNMLSHVLRGMMGQERHTIHVSLSCYHEMFNHKYRKLNATPTTKDASWRHHSNGSSIDALDSRGLAWCGRLLKRRALDYKQKYGRREKLARANNSTESLKFPEILPKCISIHT